MKILKIGILVFVSLFLALSVAGLVLCKQGERLFLINPCYKGVQPSLVFGGLPSFNYVYVAAGPKYFRYRVRILSWPGGAVGLTLVNRNLCPDATEEEMDKDTRKDMIKRPELYKDED